MTPPSKTPLRWWTYLWCNMPARHFWIKQNNTLPVLDAQLSDRDGNVDITGASVIFRMRNATTGVLEIAAAMDIIDALEGRVRYVWQPGDTGSAALYEAEILVLFLNGDVQCFPNNGYIRVEILESI